MYTSDGATTSATLVIPLRASGRSSTRRGAGSGATLPQRWRQNGCKMNEQDRFGLVVEVVTTGPLVDLTTIR